MNRIVGISGNALPNARTRWVVEGVVAQIARRVCAAPHTVAVADLVPDLGIGVRRAASPRLEEALRRIETADLLIVGSPVAKGSYSGLLKHLIDLLDEGALGGVPIGLIATGGGDLPALIAERHLRALFRGLSASILPTGVFVAEQAIIGGAIVDAAAIVRLDRLIAEAVAALAPTPQAKLALVS